MFGRRPVRLRGKGDSGLCSRCRGLGCRVWDLRRRCLGSRMGMFLSRRSGMGRGGVGCGLRPRGRRWLLWRRCCGCGLVGIVGLVLGRMLESAVVVGILRVRFLVGRTGRGRSSLPSLLLNRWLCRCCCLLREMRFAISRYAETRMRVHVEVKPHKPIFRRISTLPCSFSARR